MSGGHQSISLSQVTGQPDRGGYFTEEGAGGGREEPSRQVRLQSGLQYLPSCSCLQVQAVVHRGQAGRRLDVQLRLRQRGDDREVFVPAVSGQLGPAVRSSAHDKLCLHSQPGQAGILTIKQILLLEAGVELVDNTAVHCFLTQILSPFYKINQ